MPPSAGSGPAVLLQGVWAQDGCEAVSRAGSPPAWSQQP